MFSLMEEVMSGNLETPPTLKAIVPQSENSRQSLLNELCFPKGTTIGK